MKQKGFTLIELLVVVAIIGTLAAIGVLAYDGYTSNAKVSAAKSNCKTVINAGANVLVSGSTIFKKNNRDLKKNIGLLRSS